MTEKNNSKPTVSVVMSFNNEPLQWLKLAVDSILNQTFRNFEFIIVCDNPDFFEGIAYIKENARKDSRIQLIVNEANLGPTKSFNTAIGVSCGKYIARMDADDIALPERFERQVAYMDSHPQVSVCASDVHVIDHNGEITRKRRYRRKREQALNVIANSMAHPSIMFRSSLLDERFPIYNEDYIYSQDYELWVFLLMKGHKFHTIEEPLLLYRKSCSQISCAKKQLQVSLFKKAHKAFITDWLISRQVIEPEDDLATMLEKSSSAMCGMAEDDKEYMKYILYVLYFSMGTYSWKYRFSYLVDRNLIVFRIRFIYTFRLFVSSRTRRNRTGFN